MELQLAAHEDNGYVYFDEFDAPDFAIAAVSVGDESASFHSVRSFARFLNVPIPASSFIATAILRVRSTATYSNGLIIAVTGEAADSPAAPTDATDFSGRTRTSNTASWTAGAWAPNTDYDSPDLSAIIQEIVDRAGWATGNSLQVFVAEPDGWGGVDTLRTVKAFGHGASIAPRLIITLHEFWNTTDIVVETGQFGVTLTDQAIGYDQPVDIVVETDQFTMPTFRSETGVDIVVETGQFSIGVIVAMQQSADIVVETGEFTVTAEIAIPLVEADIVVETAPFSITDQNTLAVPTGLNAVPLGRTLIYLTWTDNAVGETGYEVWHSTNGWTYTLVDTLPAGSQQFFDADLEPGTLYHYLVRAVNSAGPYYSPFASATATTEGNMDAIFRGDAVAVAEVKSSTLGGTWIAAETITVTINGKSVVHTLASTVIATICTNLAATLNASLITEFAEITWSATSTKIVATSDTEGVLVDFAIATDSASGTVSAVTVTTANDGPNVLSAANMDGGVLPGASDNLIAENTNIAITQNLDALSGGGTLAGVYLEASYTGEVGLPRRNIDGELYWEYRVRDLTVETSLLTIGEGTGDGSGRIQVNLGSVQCAVIVLRTADPVEEGFYALRIRGTHASNTLQANGECTVDIAAEGDQAAAFATITAAGASTVRISKRTTVGTLNVYGNGVVDLDQEAALADITAINVGGNGIVVIRGDNDITAVTITENGYVDDRGSGTIETLTMGPQAAYSTEQSTVAKGGRIITNVVLTPGPLVFQNGNQTALFSNPVDLGLGGLSDYPNVDFGYKIDIAIS